MFLISVLKDYYGAQQILPSPAETYLLRKQALLSRDSANLSWWSSAVFRSHPPNLFCI
jgi:hypothetical protein